MCVFDRCAQGITFTLEYPVNLFAYKRVDSAQFAYGTEHDVTDFLTPKLKAAHRLLMQLMVFSPHPELASIRWNMKEWFMIHKALITHSSTVGSGGGG